MAKTVGKGGATAQVKKGGNPELAAILADVKSLLSQLMSAMQAGGEGEEGESEGEEGAAVQMAATTDENGAEGEGKEKDDDVEKDETARSDAEARIEELPVDDKDALAAIGKTLALLQGKAVAKSAQVARADKTTEILATIAKSLEAINRRVASNEEALIGMMEGMGVAELVQKSVPAATQAVQAPDAKAFIDMLSKALVQKSSTSPAASEGMTLGDALVTLAGQAPAKQ